MEMGDWDMPYAGLLWDQVKECGMKLEEVENDEENFS